MAAGHKDTSNNFMLRGELEVSDTLKSEPCLFPEPNLHNIGIKHLMEAGAAGDSARPVRQVADKFGAVLRRTSTRKVLRNRQPNTKTPKKSLAVVNQADSSFVRTLVPKELVNSDDFKSHILKTQDRPPRGRQPKKASKASHVPETPHIPFVSRENIMVQFPKVPPVTTKPAVEQHPGPLPLPLRENKKSFLQTQGGVNRKSDGKKKRKKGSDEIPLNEIRLKAIQKDIELAHKYLESAKRRLNLLEESSKDKNKVPIGTQRNETPAQSSRTIIPRNYDDVNYIGERLQRRIKELDLNTRGLKNLGNTCYLNAVLQLLTNVPIIVDYFVNLEYTQNFSRNSRTLVAHEIYDCIRELKSDFGAAYAPKLFLSAVSRKISEVGKKQPHDSDWFLFELLRVLSEELSVREVTVANSTLGEQHLYSHLLANPSFFWPLFLGVLKYSTTCKTCNLPCESYEILDSLKLGIPSKEKWTLLNALKQYTKKEQLPFTCERCRIPKCGWRSVTFHILPQLLVILMRRRYWHKEELWVVDLPIPFPAMISLDEETTKVKYSLIGATITTGPVDKTHIYTVILADDFFVEYNDQEVTTRTWEEIQSTQWYSLLYQRL